MSLRRLSTHAWLLIGLLLLLASAPGAAQQPPAPPPPSAQTPAPGSEPAAAAPGPVQPTFRGSIELVRVDAFVTGKGGKPVTDLTIADFEILEDGKPQKIEQFKTINVDGTLRFTLPAGQARSLSDIEVQQAEDDSRLFVFFLDDYHTRDRNAIAVREPLIKFIQSDIRPTDLLAVMYPLTPANDLAFTRNHAAVITAIQRFEGRKYDYRPRNTYEANYMRESTPVVEKIRNQVVQGALEGLAIKLGGLRDSRKTVIFVSEGFTVVLPPEMRRGDASAPQVVSGARGDERAEQGAEIQGQMDLEIRMREVYRAANRFNTAIYTLDPRGLTPFEFDISDGSIGGVSQASDRQMLRTTQDTLKSLAEETDGRAILNRNSLREGMAQILQDSSFYYLFGYTTSAGADGKFHDIKVRVKRSGVNVRSRKGFWALSEKEATRMTAPRTPDLPRPVQQALASLASPVQAARYVRTWVGTEQGTGGKTRINVVWEPLPASANAGREPVGRVSVLAATGAGDVVYRGRSPDPSTAPVSTPQPSNVGTATAPQRISFEAPPGKLDLRLTIEGATGGTLDTDSRMLDVPDLTAAGVALSTPRLFRARSARDIQIVTQDAAAVPVAGREFSRSERMLVRFDVYAASGDKPVPTVRILSRTGQKVMDVPVVAATAGGTHQLEVGLNTMAPGEYLVEIAVKAATGEAVTELVAFRLGA